MGLLRASGGSQACGAVWHGMHRDVKAMAESPGQALEKFRLLSPYDLSAQPHPYCSAAASPAQGSYVAINALCVAVSVVSVVVLD